MRIYLDMCCLKRPFDDQLDARISTETVAVDAVLHVCQENNHTLLSSDALRFENSRNPSEQRKEFAAALLAVEEESIPHTPAIEVRAAELEKAGFGLLDALHLASAESGSADVFITCDDSLLRKAQKGVLRVRVMSPGDLLKEISP
jgi:predicted nucleic acid-binding protein